MATKLLKEKEVAQQQNDVKDEPGDHFGEVLSGMTTDQLIRWRDRLEAVSRKKTVRILSYEIKAREFKAQEEERLRNEKAKVEELRQKELGDTPLP